MGCRCRCNVLEKETMMTKAVKDSQHLCLL